LKSIIIRALFIFLFGTCLFADDLKWGGTWSGVWSGFGTSPYTAIDTSKNNKVLIIFCLDYNDEIAPPVDWKANIHAVTPSNVQQFGQFGGNYGQGITAAPWAFNGDGGIEAGHAVDLSVYSTQAYTRYLEAAWLFTNIMSAQNHNDLNSMIISQVAAWDLFVESPNLNDLKNNIGGTGGRYTFNNYVYSTNNYASAPGTTSVSNVLFRDAVDEALKAAQNAVRENWYSSVWAPQWDMVTGDPQWSAAFGRPVQEFLSDAPPVPPVPEPSAIILLGTAGIGTLILARRRKAVKTQ
jgi:hypothetical protein